MRDLPRHFLTPVGRPASPIRRAPAGLKLAVATALVVGTALPRGVPLPWFAGVTGLLAAIAWLAGIPWHQIARRLLLLGPVATGLAGLSLFGPGGWGQFAVLLAKSGLCLATMVVLAATTPFGDILRVLRAAHLPPLLTTTLMLLYRYLFVLAAELERIRRARASRTFRRSRRLAWRLGGGMIGELFVRSTERAERVYAAMCARGWK